MGHQSTQEATNYFLNDRDYHDMQSRKARVEVDEIKRLSELLPAIEGKDDTFEDSQEPEEGTSSEDDDENDESEWESDYGLLNGDLQFSSDSESGEANRYGIL